MRSASWPFVSKELRCQLPLLTCFSKCLCTCCPFERGGTPCRHLQKYLIILFQTLIKTPLLWYVEKSTRKTNPPKLAEWGCWCAVTLHLMLSSAAHLPALPHHPVSLSLLLLLVGMINSAAFICAVLCVYSITSLSLELQHCK